MTATLSSRTAGDGLARHRQPATASSAVTVVRSGGMRVLVLPASALATLLTTRLVIRAVGVAAFGIVSLVSSLSALLPFADLGVGAAVVTALASCRPGQVDRETRLVLLTSLRLLCASGLVIVVGSAAVAAGGLWTPLLGSGRAAGSAGNWAVGCALLLFGLSLPLALGQRVLVGAHRSGRMVLLQGLTAPVTLGLSVLAAELGGGVVGFAVAAAGSTLLVGVVTTAAACRVTGLSAVWFARRLPQVRSRPGRSVHRTAGPMFLISIGLPVALQSDRLVLAHRASAGALATYGLAVQLYLPLWSVLTSAGLALWPLFIARRGTGQAGLPHRAVAGFVAAGSSLAAGLVLLGPAVAARVSGGAVHEPRHVFVAFACLLVVQSFQLPLGLFLTTPAGLRFQAWCVLLMVVVSLLASWLLASPWGAAGPVAGSAVAVLFCQAFPGLARTSRPSGQPRVERLPTQRTEEGMA